MMVDLRKRYVEFEKLIYMLVQRLGYKLNLSSHAKDLGYDMLAINSSIKMVIEVKYSKTKDIPASIIHNSALKSLSTKEVLEEGMQAVLILSGCVCNISLRYKIEKLFNVHVLDISNLLYLVSSFPDLKDTLLDILEFSTSNIIPTETNALSLNNNKIPNDELRAGKKDKLSDIKCRIERWNSEKHTSSEYENICVDILKNLFADELMLWKEQLKSNGDLYRFDLICKIKDDVGNGLWMLFQQFFNTKYIIFEFKNYREQITQKEIYTTEKYLYLKALRGIVIIISCEGEDTNAQKALEEFYVKLEKSFSV